MIVDIIKVFNATSRMFKSGSKKLVLWNLKVINLILLSEISVRIESAIY